MDIVEDTGIGKEESESVMYNSIGRALTQDINVLHAESGKIMTAPFFEALLVTYVSAFTYRDLFIITPDVQPLYNIKNEYMGLICYGKIRNLKKEKRRYKNIRSILSIISMAAAFIIGFFAPIFVTIVFIIAMISFGYSSFLIGRGGYR